MYITDLHWIKITDDLQLLQIRRGPQVILVLCQCPVHMSEVFRGIKTVSFLLQPPVKDNMRSPSPPACLSTALTDFLPTLCTLPPSSSRPPTWRVRESAPRREHVSVVKIFLTGRSLFRLEEFTVQTLSWLTVQNILSSRNGCSEPQTKGLLHLSTVLKFNFEVIYIIT